MKVVKLLCERTYNISDIEFHSKTKSEKMNYNNYIKNLAENAIRESEFGDLNIDAYSEIPEDHIYLFPEYTFFANVETERDGNVLFIGFCDDLSNILFDIERMEVNKDLKERL